MIRSMYSVVRVVPVLFAIFVTLLIILAIQMCLYAMDFPRKIGEVIHPEDAIRRLLFKAVSPDEIRAQRDMFVGMIENEMFPPTENDRWSELRKIDHAQETVVDQLKSGEFIISVAGSLLALGLGNFVGLALAGVTLTMVAVAVSFFVAFRIIVTDLLSYSTTECRHYPMRRLVACRGWQEGPILGTGAVAVVFLAAVAPISESGYRIGISIVEFFIRQNFGDEDPQKWKIAD